MSAQLLLNAPEPETATLTCLEPQAPHPGHAAALLWLREAVSVVESVYPSVSWSRNVPPEVDAAFQEAWGAYWIDGSISKDEMLVEWRKYYGACL